MLYLCLLYAAAISAITTTIAKGRIFKPFRQLFPWSFFRCPYCMAHWLSFLAAMLLTTGHWLDWLVISFALVSASSIFTLVNLLVLKTADTMVD